MILLPVDEAYALDYYAILLVKRDNGLPVQSELERTESFLRIQITGFENVIASAEFHLLYVANDNTFRAVAACRGSAAQTANRQRFKAKCRVQERFWPNNPITETKARGD